MNAGDVERLATFNGERARGLLHRPDYVEEMAALKAQFDAETRTEALRQGHIVVGPTYWMEKLERTLRRGLR